jgi:DNA repair exonuclease SbcCD ATPase subunit
MKISKLIIKNVGLIEDTAIETTLPLILFYGEIRAGKSTILKAVRWCLGGNWPTDIIRHGAKEAEVSLEFDGGIISRSWYVAKDGATKARDIIFVRNGKPVPSPAAEIKRFLNPFLINQDLLLNMTEGERKKYFTDLFAVDTTALDKELFESERKAQELRAEIKGYGEIDLTPVEVPDVAALNETRTAIIAEAQSKANEATREATVRQKSYADECNAIRARNQVSAGLNAEIARVRDQVKAFTEEIAKLQGELEVAISKRGAQEKWLYRQEEKTPEKYPEQPDISDLVAIMRAQADTSAVDAQIQAANALAIRAEQLARNVARDNERKAKAADLTAREARQKAIKAERITRLKSISETCGVPGLTFDESGNFSFQGTQAGMLSTSQIMELSTKLSALYPEGFGLDLIDRGESLGESIFGYIEEAQKRNVTILAAIVGRKPATVPENVGVFVVKAGQVIPD